MQMSGYDSRFVRRLEYHGARSVTEQHAGASIGPVQDAGQRFRAHHQRAPRGSRSDELVSHAERIHKSGAHRLHIECRAAMHTEPVLEQAGGAREDRVRRGGADHDEIDIPFDVSEEAF